MAAAAADKKAVAFRPGIQTPGIQIPFASLKAEADFSTTSNLFFLLDSVLLPNAEKKTLDRIELRSNKPGDPIAGINRPCSGAAQAFKSLWVPDCGDGSILRLEPKTGKLEAKLAIGAANVRVGIVATADSVWAITDSKTTLSRIDPDQNQVVAEVRLGEGCNSLASGDGGLWINCPTENRIVRVNPLTNLVEKRIEVSARPMSLAFGEGSLWVFCQKEGKVERIDPKTNKVIKTIELGVPGADGDISIGAGFVWITQTGFPITRIDPQTDKVAQQFYGDGGGMLQASANAVWLLNVRQGTLCRIDPKRIAATLAE
jgi:DNA-binding beta-propeller fold protein YncE